MQLIIKQGTEDGYIYAGGATWPPTTKVADTANATHRYGCSLEDSTYYIMRSYLRFNTALIPPGAKITNCKLWLKLNAKDNVDNFNVALLLLKAASDWNPLDTGDWGCGSIQVASKAYADLPALEQWFSLDIDPVYLNLTGYTAFEIKGDHESGTAPTGLDRVKVYSADSAGNEPYLEIIYNPWLQGLDERVIVGGG